MTWPVSSQFMDELVSGGNKPIFRMSVLSGGGVVFSSDAVSSYDVPILNGSVNMFKRADVRRRLSLELVDVTGSIVPLQIGDLFHPVTGNELRVERGFELPDTTKEYVPLGIFTSTNLDLTENSGAVSFSFSGLDRSFRVANNPWRTSYIINAGTNTGTAIRNLITDRLTGVGTVIFSFEATTQTVATKLVLGSDGSDPWKDAQNLAAGIGMELFFDGAGVCILRTIPNTETTNVAFTYELGESGILLDPVTRSIDRATLRNGAIVISEAPWLVFPLTSKVWDDDAASPLRRALIGEFPEKSTSPTVFSQAQADAAAAALFKEVHGVQEQLRWSAVANPALEEGDVVRLNTEYLFGTEVRLALDEITTPLGWDSAQEAQARRRMAL